MSNTYVEFVSPAKEPKAQIKKRKRKSSYANIGTEEKRLKYLYFRDYVMARTIVAKQ